MAGKARFWRCCSGCCWYGCSAMLEAGYQRETPMHTVETVRTFPVGAWDVWDALLSFRQITAEKPWLLKMLTSRRLYWIKVPLEATRRCHFDQCHRGTSTCMARGAFNGCAMEITNVRPGRAPLLPQPEPTYDPVDLEPLVRARRGSASATKSVALAGAVFCPRPSPPTTLSILPLVRQVRQSASATKSVALAGAVFCPRPSPPTTLSILPLVRQVRQSASALIPPPGRRFRSRSAGLWRRARRALLPVAPGRI